MIEYMSNKQKTPRQVNAPSNINRSKRRPLPSIAKGGLDKMGRRSFETGGKVIKRK